MQRAVLGWMFPMIPPPVIHDAQHLRVLKAEKDRMIEASEARLDDCVPSVKPAKKDKTPGVFFDVMLVRRQSFWDWKRLKLRECLARLVCNVMRLAEDVASGGWRLSVV
jgi:hypothetical protein